LYIRNVTLKLKKDTVNDFKRIAESDVLPMLRKQNGFRDEILCVAPQRLEALAISFWDSKEAADVYEKTTYPNVVKSLSNLLDGTPRVEPFELSFSTLHKIAAKA
jgi:quinol monooxygenase YgiN